MKVNIRPELRPPALHSKVEMLLPIPFWTPTVALLPLLVTVP